MHLGYDEETYSMTYLNLLGCEARSIVYVYLSWQPWPGTRIPELEIPIYSIHTGFQECGQH